MTERLLEIIESSYLLEPLPVDSEFSSMKVNGMKFTLEAWHADGLGHVSYMKASGFFGLMKMDTLIITPENIDLPLLSYDRIKAMGNDTLIIELYDTTITPYDASPLGEVKKRYQEIPERDPGKHWYDDIKLKESISKKGKDSKKIDMLADEYITAYIRSSAPEVKDRERKKEKTEYYVTGLLSNGGPSTDVFMKKLGNEKTEKLFEKILFGTSR